MTKVSRLLFFFFLLIIVVLPIVGCNTTSADNRDEKAMKGYELYSWKGKYGRWMFSVLVGTNRSKNISEVQQTPMEIKEIKARFCKMAKGEQIVWQTGIQDIGSGEQFELPIPPDQLIDELINMAASCKVELLVPYE